MNAHIHSARHGLGVPLDFFRDLMRDFEFVAFHLNVDRRRQPSVERGAQHSARVKVELDSGKLLGQFFAQLINVRKS